MKKLKPYIRDGLDVLFVALNPPEQSHFNGHWFSGKSSRFFHLLYQSGLITRRLQKETADEIVFGTTEVNHRAFEFGVIDLVGEVVETNSKRVHPTREHVEALFKTIREYKPRSVCVIHSKVRRALQRHGQIETELKYGECGFVLNGCHSRFFVNYFPNGNNINDERKIQIFRSVQRSLEHYYSGIGKLGDNAPRFHAGFKAKFVVLLGDS